MHDGLVFNGYAIYAATEQRKPHYRPGFVETNEIFGGLDDRYVYYGKDEISQYAQDLTSGAWVELDVPSWDVMDAFPSFDAMLARMLRHSLKWIDGVSID
jgi:hypothetical protein